MNDILANVTGVAIGGRALLIAGPPGSGKSSLALALIDRGGVLIGDDAVAITARDNQVWAAPPPNTGGMIEVRNVGIVELPTTEAPVALMLTLDEQAPRFPMQIEHRPLCGIEVPALKFRAGDSVQALRAEYAVQKHGLPFPPAPTMADTSSR